MIGQTIGSYTIIAKLGEGGMGEVYRAKDSKLKREVALKVLPADVANDRERLARFQREAEVLASLNHPHIAHVYGIEANALVMELVEGEDLYERLKRGAIPIDETLQIASQIAEALAAAHDAGIIHRDLKPANIKVRPDNTVKVLDFGLAKALEAGSGTLDPGSDNALANSPTITSPAMTMRGVILGTAAYMAPEQAKGKAVDKRADIWAFGCVLFEMLSGRRTFSGETTTEIIAAVIEREPDWALLPRNTPASVRRLLRRMLAKRTSERLRDIGDAKHDLRLDDGDEIRVEAPRARWPIVAAASVAAAVIGAASMAYLLPLVTSTPPPSSPALMFTLPGAGQNRSAAQRDLTISADGGTIAWTAPGKDGVVRLWIRRLTSPEAIELAGTDNATLPFLSPDGHAAGFFAGGALKRVDVSSGAMQALAPAAQVSLGGSWSRDDVILFSNRFGLYRIPAGGGTPQLVVPLNKALHENSLRYPQFLPDGRRFLYVARSGRPEDSGAYLGSLDAPPRRLFTTLAKVMFAPPDQLLFVRDSVLLAQRIDLSTGELRGSPTTITADLSTQSTGLGAGYAVSETGVLAYAPAREEQTATLHWFDRAGRDLGAFDQPRTYAQFRLSPDGRRVAAAVPDPARGSRSIWILEAGAPAARFTLSGTHDWEPVWSADGTRIVYGSYRNGPLDIYVKDVAGVAPESPLLLSDVQKDVSDWSPDGRFVLFRDVMDTALGDLFAMEVANPANRIRLTTSPTTDDRIARWSGDGKWIAYVSTETGDAEVFVQPFPPTGALWQVSVGGGDEPTWRGDGRELYYLDRSGMLIAVSVDGSAASFASVRSRPLWRIGSPAGAFGNKYDVTRDGTRFLVSMDDPRPPARPPVVVMNWPSQIKTGGTK